MASRRGDEGQVILLAGILLVLAFILFSTQLALLATLGQQAGRESENPLLEDHLLLRRTLQTLFQNELQNQTGVLECPDLVAYGQRVHAQLELVEAQEGQRGHAFEHRDLGVRRVDASNLQVNVTVLLTDGQTSIGESLSYAYACEGTIATPPGGLPELPDINYA